MSKDIRSFFAPQSANKKKTEESTQSIGSSSQSLHSGNKENPSFKRNADK